MAVNNVTSGGLPSQLPGTRASFELSPVEKIVAQTKTQTAKAKNANFFTSESYFKAKSNQLRYMMALYQNFGLTEEFKAVEAEAIRIVKEYTKLYGVPKTGSKTSVSA